MRLRPWGDGSALAISHAALEKYLSQHGREWERYAWIKARVVTGGKEGQDLLEMTRPLYSAVMSITPLLPLCVI